MERTFQMVVALFRAWWWGDPSMLSPRDDVSSTMRKCAHPVSRFVCWFLWGGGLTHTTGNVVSGVGFAISLLTLVLGGTVSLGVAVHNTGYEGWYWALLYGLIGIPVLGAMASILRTSNLGASETRRRVCRGEAENVSHNFDRGTIYFTRWALASCAALYLLSAVLAFSGHFFGQQPRTIELPVWNVVDYDYERTEGYIGRPGLIAQFSINKNVYSNGVPRNVVLSVVILPKLSEDWKLAPRFDVVRCDPAPHQDKPDDACAFLSGSEQSHSQQVEVLDLAPDADYRLDAYLVAKRKECSPGEAKTLIRFKRRMIVTDVTLDQNP